MLSLTGELLVGGMLQPEMRHQDSCAAVFVVLLTTRPQQPTPQELKTQISLIAVLSFTYSGRSHRANTLWVVCRRGYDMVALTKAGAAKAVGVEISETAVRSPASASTATSASPVPHM